MDDSAGTFVRSGWVCLPSFLSCDELSRLQLWAAEIEGYQGDECLRYYETTTDGRRILSRVEKIIELGSASLSFLLLPSSQLMVTLVSLVQDDVILFKDKLNLKLSGGGGYSVHQDAPAYYGFNISYFVTVMIAIDEATIASGCIEFATGLRTARLLERDSRGEIIEAEIQSLQFQPSVMHPGDVAIFDDLVPHRSAPNHSNSARRALFLTFNKRSEGDKRASYYDLRRNLFPPEDKRISGRDYQKIGKQFKLGNPFD